VIRLPAFLAGCIALSLAATAPGGAADANAGAALVQANGCAGCHGATLTGGIGPSLVGIEGRRSAVRIAAAIAQPVAPMPKFPFSTAQIANIVAYLSALDSSSRPVARLRFSTSLAALLSVRFPGPLPARVTAVPVMQMGQLPMRAAAVTLHPTAGGRLWQGTIQFPMSGPWAIEIAYDGRHLTVPVNVPGSR